MSQCAYADILESHPDHFSWSRFLFVLKWSFVRCCPDYLLNGETVIDLLVWMKLKRIDIPVIAVSAAADEALSVAAIKSGADCFYDKLDFTLSKIYEVLEKHQS